MKKKKGISSVFAVILFAVFFVAIMSISSYYIQTSTNFWLNESDFTLVSDNVRNDFCFEELGINYTYNPISPNEPYCTAFLNVNTKKFSYNDSVEGLNFTGWYLAYVENNQYVEDDKVNTFVDRFLFLIIVLMLLFSIFAVWQKETVSDLKIIFWGIFGVPMGLFVFVILTRLIGYLLELLETMFPHLAMINIYAPFPLLDHFFSNIMWYIIPYIVLWVLGAVLNKEVLADALGGGAEK